MTGEEIFRELGSIDSQLVLNAAPRVKVNKKIYYKKWLSLAACMSMIVGIFACVFLYKSQNDLPSKPSEASIIWAENLEDGHIARDEGENGADDNPLSRCTSATVTEVVVFYGTKNYTLTSDELIEFVTLLNNITAFTRDDTLLDSDGDDFWYIGIQLKDRTDIVLDVHSPYIVVDGNGYKVDESACISLENYIQNIVNTTVK